MTLAYRNVDGEATTRSVDPYAVIYSNGEWQLVGHCHLRNAVRVFRVDRISHATVAPRPATCDFQRPQDWSLEAHLRRSPWVFQGGESSSIEVVMDVGVERAWVAQEEFGPHATREVLAAEAAGDGPCTRIRFRTGNPEYVIARVLDGAGHLRIVSPPHLVALIRERALAVARLCQEPAA